MPAESIYNLVSKKKEILQKSPMYRSKYPGDLPPTASTFGATQTTQLGVTNMDGDINWKPSRDFKRETATFGKPYGSIKERPDMFLKKQTRELPEAHKFKYQDQDNRKPAIPKKDDQPLMGLSTAKNYVLSNALENMLAKPPKEKTVKFADQTQINESISAENNNSLNNSTLNIADKHPEFGKVPEYLKTIKAQVQQETDYIKSLNEQNNDAQTKFAKKNKLEMLEDSERLELLNSMKEKWEKINAAYQQMTIHVMPETKSSLKRKESYEAEMTQLEKDIEMLSKKYVFVKQ